MKKIFRVLPAMALVLCGGLLYHPAAEAILDDQISQLQADWMADNQEAVRRDLLLLKEAFFLLPADEQGVVMARFMRLIDFADLGPSNQVLFEAMGCDRRLKDSHYPWPPQWTTDSLVDTCAAKRGARVIPVAQGVALSKRGIAKAKPMQQVKKAKKRRHHAARPPRTH